MAQFDKKVWSFPGNLGLTLHGHSRASEATCFHIPELGWALDGGIAIDKHVMSVFITHGHMDHAQMLPHLLSRVHQTTFYVPEGLLKFASTYMLASHQMNDATETPYPRNYSFLPVKVNQTYELPGKKKCIMRPVECLHPVPCVGYCFWERRAKLKEEYKAMSGAEIGKLRKAGVAISDEVEVPLFVFMGDTSPNVFSINPHLLDFPVVITECTFLQDEQSSEGGDADSKGHTSWVGLRPFIVAHPATIFVIIHFSYRYKNAEIIEHFRKENLPNVVPWVDDS